MNYLAHAFLSFDRPAILAGNMISDFVKGRDKFNFPLAIQHGIQLHREIDSFTDSHDATRDAKEVFRPAYRLYSGAFVDVVYDHFLAKDPEFFPPGRLEVFARNTYRTLEQHTEWLPQPFLLMLPYMKHQNWLLNYAEASGIHQSMRGLVRRSAYLSSADEGFQVLNDHYAYLEACYRGFIPDVKKMAEEYMKQLEPNP